MKKIVPGCCAHILAEIKTTFNQVHMQFLVKIQITFLQVNSHPRDNPNDLFLAVLVFVTATYVGIELTFRFAQRMLLCVCNGYQACLTLKTNPKIITDVL